MPDPKKPHHRNEPERTGGISRRDFLTVAGAGAIAASTATVAAREREGGRREPAAKNDTGLREVSLRINGRTYNLLVEPRWSLLFVLRERLGLSAAKAGCERGECGCCTVLLDGTARYACMILTPEAEGGEITTAEGLMSGEEAGVVQAAFQEEDAFQCGYCTPGQVMAVEGLLRASPSPSLEEIRLGISGNLCRCGAYPNIVRAAGRAARMRQAGEDRS